MILLFLKFQINLTSKTVQNILFLKKKLYHQQLIQSYKYMVHDWNHLGKFQPMQITKQGMQQIFQAHCQKRREISQSNKIKKPHCLYVKTGKYFLDDNFISKNSVLIDNLGRDDSANVIKEQLKHTRDTFYLYCISTTNSIFTIEEQIHISNFLKLKQISKTLFAFSFYRNLDGKQDYQLRQTIQNIYISIFKIIPFKLLEIIQKQWKHIEERRKKSDINSKNEPTQMEQKLHEALKILKKYQQEFYKCFPKEKFQEIKDDSDQEQENLFKKKDVSNKYKKFSQEQQKLNQLKKSYPFNLIKIFSPNLNHLKHKNMVEIHSYKNDITLFDQIQKKSEFQAKNKIKQSILNIKSQFYQQVQNKAKQIIRNLQNRMLTCNKEKEQVQKVEKLVYELRKYHQKLKAFLSQEEDRLNKIQSQIFVKIKQNLRIKYKQYQNKQLRNSYMFKPSIEDQILESTQKLFKESNEQITKNFTQTYNNFKKFLEKQLKNKQYGLLSLHLKLFLNQFFKGNLMEKSNNFLIQKYYQSMCTQVMNLIKAKQQIWHNFINNIQDFLKKQNIQINLNIIRYTQIIASLGFSATVGFSIAGRTLLRFLLPILGVGAFITTIAIPIVTGGTCIYYGVKVIKNRRKQIKHRFQKDKMFFQYRWQSLGQFYDQAQELLNMKIQNTENVNEKWITNFDQTDYISQLIGVLSEAEPTFLKQKIEILKNIQRQAKNKNIRLGISYNNGLK